MELAFRKFPAGDVPPPDPGEMLIRAVAVDRRARREMASLVLARGVEPLPRGPGLVERVVVDSDPTLDDLLAAAFAMRLLSGQGLPEGSKAFARYAGLVREGLKPSNIPLETSLEGLYLAVRNSVEGDLLDPEVGSRFAEAWSRMAECILRAAEAGQDPFTTPLFTSECDFARERAFLVHDRDVYRRDVLRGEQWLVAIPGGPPRGSALLLRRPKSLLFKYWSRGDDDAPVGHTYLFLAVDWGEGQWVFSTDPVNRLPIKPLAEQLQAAEAAADPGRAQNDPWFDGRAFDHTLVAAPRGGTTLPPEHVLRIVKRWLRARPPSRRKAGWKIAATACAAACLVLGTILFPRTPGPPPPTDPPDRVLDRGVEIIESDRSTPVGPRKGKDYALLVATDKYTRGWQRLRNPVDDARAIAKELEDTYGFEKPQVLENPGQEEILGTLRRYIEAKNYHDDDQLFIFFAGHGAYDNTTDEGYVVASDSILRQKEKQSYLQHSQLAHRINEIPCKHIFVVMDVCYGGTFAGAERSRGDGPYEKVSKEKFIARKMRYKARKYLTSGGKDYVSDGLPGQHSPFARSLLEMLRSKGGEEGILTMKQIVAHVDELDPEPRSGGFGADEANSDFLFIPRSPSR
jgi:hypothetical protein